MTPQVGKINNHSCGQTRLCETQHCWHWGCAHIPGHEVEVRLWPNWMHFERTQPQQEHFPIKSFSFSLCQTWAGGRCKQDFVCPCMRNTSNPHISKLPPPCFFKQRNRKPLSHSWDKSDPCFLTHFHFSTTWASVKHGTDSMETPSSAKGGKRGWKMSSRGIWSNWFSKTKAFLGVEAKTSPLSWMLHKNFSQTKRIWH